MCPIKQILTRMKAFCRRNPLKAISTSMLGPSEVMAGFECTVAEMNVMPTVAYLNEIVLRGGGSVLVWVSTAHGFCTNLFVIEGNLNAQRYRDEIIPLFQNNANITLFPQPAD